MPDPAAPSTTTPTLPPGAHFLQRRHLSWLLACSLVLVALASVAVYLASFGNFFEWVILGCCFLGFFAAIFLWSSFWVWLEARLEMNDRLRGEELVRWQCNEREWELLDPQWKVGEPLGEISLTRHSVFAGSEDREILFASWRWGRQHLSRVELQSGTPCFLHLDISVPSSGRRPGYKIPLVLPVPPEHRGAVHDAVDALRNSDAVHPKGESIVDILLLIAMAGVLGAGILYKLGVIR